MDKQAMGIGTAINTGLNAMTVVDGAKQAKKAYNDVNNKYDNLMGTNIIKSNNTMGTQNAMIASKTASQQIDDLYKMASFKDVMGKGFAGANKFINGPNGLAQKIDMLDKANTKEIGNLISGIKNRNFSEIGRSLPKTMKVSVPALAGMIGAGIGTAKLLDSLDKNRRFNMNSNPEDKLEYNAIGAGVTGALMLSALANKSMLKPASMAVKVLGNEIKKYPMRQLTAKNKAAKFVKSNFDTIAKGVNSGAAMKLRDDKVIGRYAKEIENYVSRSKGGMSKLERDRVVNSLLSKAKKDFLYNNSSVGLEKARELWDKTEKGKVLSKIEKAFDMFLNLNKKASEIINDCVELNKTADTKSEFAKNLFKEHFLKPGLKSIPYYAAPAAAGFMLNRNLRDGFKKLETNRNKQSLDNIPTQEVTISEKKAFEVPKISPEGANKAKYYAKRGLELGVEGIGRTVFPAAVTAVTGRNIVNSFAKIDDHQQASQQENMAKNVRRLVIDVQGNPSNQKIKREINKQVNSMNKQAAINNDTSYDVGDVLHSTRKSINKQFKDVSPLSPKMIHIGPGVKQKYKLNS